ncbi:MAG: hypothetical protein AAF447_03235 [Myxococcota bacterium]
MLVADGADGGAPPDASLDGDVPDMGGPPDVGSPDLSMDLGRDTGMMSQTPAPVLERTDPESPGNTGMPLLIGSSAPGAQVSIFTNGSCADAPVEVFASMGDFAERVNVERNTPTNLSALALAPGMSVSECSNVLRYLWDAMAPSVPVIESTDPASPSTAATVTASGRADPGALVVISFDGSCGGEEVEVLADDAGRFTVDLEVPFGDTVLTARALDEADNASACSEPFVHSRVLDAEVIFPPAPGVTGLDELTVRARVEGVDASASVILESPAGRRAAIYDSDADEWRALVPLIEGEQTLSVSLAGVPGGATAALIDVTQGNVPGSPTQVIWDPLAMALLITDGSSVLEVDPSTGAATARLDASASYDVVSALAVDGTTTYLAGIDTGGSVLVSSWDGMALTEIARLGTAFAGPEHLDVRDGGAELMVFRTPVGVSVVDVMSGTTRTLGSGTTRCFTYSPEDDEGLRCGGGASTFETVDIDTGAVTPVGTLTGPVPGFVAEARYDASADRYIVRDFTGAFFALDLDALTVDRLGSVAFVEQFGVRGDTGGLVVTERVFAGSESNALVTLDPATGALGLIELLGIGAGEELGPPTAAALEGQRAFVSDGPRILEVALGVEGGGRMLRASGAGSEAFIATVFEPGTDRFFALSEDGSLREGTFGGSTSLIAPGSAFGALFGDVAVRPASGMAPGELLEVSVGRSTVLARPFDSIGTPRSVGTVEVTGSDGPIAVAFDGDRDEVGVLSRQGTAAVRITAFPVAGGGAGRVVADLPSPTTLFSTSRDLAYAGDRYYVGNGPELLLVDARSGTVRSRATFPGNLLQVTAPIADGVGFAALQNARGFAAFDARRGDWVIIGR